MSNSGHESDDDSAPESVSFESSKIENTEQHLKIKEQINSIRESQKKKRIERQEKYIEQKVGLISLTLLDSFFLTFKFFKEKKIRYLKTTR